MADDAQATGTQDATYNLISILYHSLQGAETYEMYAADADDDGELQQFFTKVQHEEQQRADQAKQLLATRLAKESGTSRGGSMSSGGEMGGASSGGSQ